MSSPTPEEVAAFKQAWHKKNQEPFDLPVGARTTAGLAAAFEVHDAKKNAEVEEMRGRVAYAAAIVTGDARWDKQEELERVTAELAELRRAYQKLWSDSDGMRR